VGLAKVLDRPYRAPASRPNYSQGGVARAAVFLPWASIERTFGAEFRRSVT